MAPTLAQVLYPLLRKQPLFLRWYLFDFVFPITQEYQTQKLSASGQEIGGDLVFGRRMGFSGTPSDLIPVEFRPCQFEEGDDGKIITTLTAPAIVDYTAMPDDWTVAGLLDMIAAADPPYHALIDTGALITGMSNYQVRAAPAAAVSWSECLELRGERREGSRRREGCRCVGCAQGGQSMAVGPPGDRDVAPLAGVTWGSLFFSTACKGCANVLGR